MTEAKRITWTRALMAAVVIGIGAITWHGCIRITNAFSAIPPGTWRASLIVAKDSADLADERSGGVLPFNFEVVYETEDSFYIEIHNGTERIRCTDIRVGFDSRYAKDTLRIMLPVFGSYITGMYEEDAIDGAWWDPSRSATYSIPFKAYHGQDHRFEIPAGAGHADFSGRWKATFRVETETPYTAIGVFEQNENEATGTFLTETGDYRFLDGNVLDNRMFLSAFDGSHAYLFEAKMLDDGTISGTFRSGNHYKTYWTAVRDTGFALRDPNTLTELSDSAATFAFSLPNPDGEVISPDDPQYAGKPKIVSIFGTWCPNCLDENAFLSDYFARHPDTGVEIISIAFERRDSVAAMQAIRNYKQHFDIPWQIVYGGTSNKAAVAEKLPLLDKFLSFPTMLFLDEGNRIVKIHTGFYGPATEHYDAFVQDFEQTVQSLTAHER